MNVVVRCEDEGRDQEVVCSQASSSRRRYRKKGQLLCRGRWMGIKNDGGLGYNVDINGPRQGSSA